ncbi:beta-ribofuranosylaminobenzene 5'-phosphate synthase [Ramlibacter sp. G-1-2-2]|uniref:Beta-ribofuranosylaminobenzene 5'-phosphate synthase n=1 Tax=Ramlibacter agri TaxID=2728837 RepID=A0A848H462_9BURK|nr:beta-ribofuranosylaminobenzene 5'-phosphate synthase family protein [Ramlibacter agri]NML45585.1 beta-ribofuranosylaminobenzene 5'-phosphate synthase [Ramlibacter agri]
MRLALAPEAETPLRTWPAGRVRVHAPARLHLGFLDPGASLGRAFGSLGLAIAGPETALDLSRAEADCFDAAPGCAAALERARAHLETLRQATGMRAPVALRLRSALPAHVGLGSGTQLAVALGRAFSELFGLDMESARIAALLGRGARSGVGIAAFDQGGLLLDGGPRADGGPPALLARIALPPAWRVLLVLDARLHGLSGAAEKAALARLAPLPREAAAEICHQVLMRILPGAAGAEFAPFAAGITRMQEVLGAHFAPAQDGSAFTSAAAGRLLRWMSARAGAGIGQSSWGPAGFAILPSEAAARELLAEARAGGLVDPALDLLVTAARNHGALVSDARAGA